MPVLVEPAGPHAVEVMGRDGRCQIRARGERSQLFDRKADADRHDSNMRADISRGRYVDPTAGKVTVRGYADAWRAEQLHRASTTDMVERAFRLHILPRLGELQMSAVRPSHLCRMVKDRSDVLAASTVHLVFGYVASMFRAAVADRVIGTSPCIGVRLPAIEREDRFIPSPAQVHAVAAALPARLRAAPYLAAGCGLRPSEVLGVELGHVDFLRRTVTVAQQVGNRTGEGTFLAPLKTKTSARGRAA